MVTSGSAALAICKAKSDASEPAKRLRPARSSHPAVGPVTKRA
jgi:hypothetical protein